MRNNMKTIVGRFFADRVRRKRTAQIAVLLSVVVVAGVFWQLMTPAITMTPDPICGKTEHTHSEACWQSVLTCALTEDAEHVHGDSCYERVLACGMSEHVHDASCYPEVYAEPTIGAGENEPAPQSDVAAEPTDSDATVNPDATDETPAADENTDPSATPTTDETPAVDENTDPSATPTTGETPAVEQTPVPAPVLESLSASADRVFVGQSVTWTFAASDVSELTYVVTGADGQSVAEGTIYPADRQFTWTAGQAGVFSLTLTAANESGAATLSGAAVTVEETAELTAAIYAGAKSCFAGDSVTFYMTTSGGAELTAFDVTVSQNGAELAHQQYITDSITVTAADAGSVTELTATLTVTDALGNTDTSTCTIPVALTTEGDASAWAQKAVIRLSGVWPEDLLEVARTQIGYTESSVNFIVRDDGTTQGYTLYGDWYGMPYEEWCAMFASFCLENAGVPEGEFPRSAGCDRWISDLRYYGLYAEADEYAPQAGDLIFFDWDGDGSSDHVGIVTGATETELTTIEGNSGRTVREKSYAINDTQIMGYGLVNAAYADYAARTAAADEPEDLVEDLIPADAFEVLKAEIEAAADEAALVEAALRVEDAYEAGALTDEEYEELLALLNSSVETEAPVENPVVVTASVEETEDGATLVLTAALNSISAENYNWQWQIAEAEEGPWTNIEGETGFELRVALTEENENSLS